ncbi:MAG TPA: chorismate mutase [Pyrinomonadaceae bacterium]|nr:chorismate mutase [Pyrinomonadaceae bacterium]
MTIEAVRTEIDTIDREIVELLARRGELVGNIGRQKAAAGIPINDRRREALVYERVIDIAQGRISNRAVTAVFSAILDESRRSQLRIREEIFAGVCVR